MKQTTQINQYELPIKITPQKDGGFVVTCPIWTDCYAQGETIDEAILEITAVAQSLIEIYKEENRKIPLKHAGSKPVKSPHFLPIIVAA